MKKALFSIALACAICMSGTIMLCQNAVAGPFMEFGDEGYLQLDFKFQGIADFTNFGGGDDGQESRSDLYLRRARIVMTGMLNDTWGAKFQTCGGTSSTRSLGGGGYALAQSNSKLNSNIRLTDGYLFGLFNKHLNMKLGLTKIPMTRGNLDECFGPLSTERSIFAYTPFGTDATKFSRDMGLVLSGNFFEDHFKYYVAAMEGREGGAKFYNAFADKTFTSTAEPKSNLSYYARVHYSFLDPEGGPTSMGYKGTYLGEKGTVLTIGGAVGYEADAAYKYTYQDGLKGEVGIKNSDGSITKNTDTVDYFAWTTDIFFECPLDDGDAGVITATAVYFDVDFDDAYKTNGSVADQNTIVGGNSGQKDGYYVKGAYILPYTIGEDGLLQPFARYEDWNVASFLGVQNQGVQMLGLGFNYFPLGDMNLRFSAEWARTYFDKQTALGDYTDFQTGTFTKYDDYDVFTLMFMVQI